MRNEMQYTKLFDSRAKPVTKTPYDPDRPDNENREGQIYIYDVETELAINLALATKRPLLVRGPSGSGKSTLAKNVAFIKGWRYYETVMSSRSSAEDLQWRFDAVRRLSDALQPGRDVSARAQYLEPGVLWWAFDRKSARERTDGSDPTPWRDTEESDRAVVLIDEIDKADPDVPNNLLVPLGALRFSVPDLGVEVKASVTPLVIITTNDERALPNAFIRRCVVTTLRRSPRERMLEIATAHLGPDSTDLYARVADVLERIAEAKEKRGQPPPSTAEYLDALSACIKLDISPSNESEEWRTIIRSMFVKARSNDEQVP
jgi:MoxR-like ATPase